MLYNSELYCIFLLICISWLFWLWYIVPGFDIDPTYGIGGMHLQHTHTGVYVYIYI